MILSRLRTGLAAALLLCHPLAAAALEARPVHRVAAIHPALWRLSGPGSTIWLFGTIHALPPHFEWETPALRRVLARADRLVLEAVIDRDVGDAGTALVRLGTARTRLPPLADRVAPGKRVRLVQMIGRAGVTPATLDGMKTWAAGMVLFGLTVTQLGVSAADGVEEQLKAQFRAAGKPVEGLETLDQQLGYFDQMTEDQQRQFLDAVIDDDGKGASDFGRMLGAWSRGDERGIQASFDQDMKATDALQSVLIARRNRRWADQLAARLARPGTAFVAVGAGHLVGPQSVQSMLRAMGVRAERVQ